jgi:hypothetical protein
MTLRELIKQVKIRGRVNLVNSKEELIYGASLLSESSCREEELDASIICMYDGADWSSGIIVIKLDVDYNWKKYGKPYYTYE